MTIFDRILKQLKKGNSVLLLVNYKSEISNADIDKIRLITPETCDYTWQCDKHGREFIPSCFLFKDFECEERLPIAGPEDIVRLMKKNDEAIGTTTKRKITYEMQVIPC